MCLGSDSKSILYIYAKSLHQIKQEDVGRTRISLSSDGEVSIRDLIPVSASKVLVVIEKKRDSLKIQSSDRNSDDTISHMSRVSHVSKQHVSTTDRFLNQVMKIGKLGGIQFQANDFSEELKTPQVQKKEPLGKFTDLSKSGMLSDSDDDTFSVNTMSMTSQSQLSDTNKSYSFLTLTGQGNTSLADY